MKERKMDRKTNGLKDGWTERQMERKKIKRKID